MRVANDHGIGARPILHGTIKGIEDRDKQCDVYLSRPRAMAINAGSSLDQGD